MTTPSANARAGFLLVLLALVFTNGLIHAFAIRFASGDVYSDDSSMRNTPTGAKLLYESLSRTPGLAVARNYYPLEYLEESNATIFLLGLNAGQFGDDAEDYAAIDRLTKRGNRVVAAFDWKRKTAPEAELLAKKWGVKYAVDQERLSFNDAPGWHVLERDGSRVLVMDRDFQQGSVVLVADTRRFENGSIVQLRSLDLVSAVIGGKQRVVFDESHLGTEESGTVLGLARRFRLTGMAAGLALCAALFLWKNTAAFPPPTDAPRAQNLTGRTSIAGLHTLLQRHIRPEELAATCWSEWLIGKRREMEAGRLERVRAILRDQGRQPLEAVRAIQTLLETKGPL